MKIPHAKDSIIPKTGVFRKTELHGTVPAQTRAEQERVRSRTQKNLRSPDSDVAYVPFDTAFRDLICSVIQRQDRIREELLMLDADLRQQITALEVRMGKNGKQPVETPEEH